MSISGKKANTVGFTNGCFDILHVGHINLIRYLKNRCDLVIIGIDSDRRVKELKGENRPFNKEQDRKLMLQSLRFVDRVYIFDSEQELTEMVESIKPELMVVGSDYKNRRVIGSEHAKSLEFFEKIDGHSTTKILQYSSDRRQL